MNEEKESHTTHTLNIDFDNFLSEPIEQMIISCVIPHRGTRGGSDW